MVYNKHQITIIGFVSVVGQVLPPFVTFEGHSLGYKAKASYLSPKGWVDTEVFHAFSVTDAKLL